MANRYRNLAYSAAEYTHIYRNISGVELSGSDITSSPSRLARAVNMYKDYESDGADVIETFPGTRILARLGERLNGIYCQRSPDGTDALLIHSNNKLRRIPLSSQIGDSVNIGEPIGERADRESVGISYGKYFYILDGEKLARVDGNGNFSEITDEDAAPHIPTLYVSGEEYEARNLLTDKFKEEYKITDPAIYGFSSDGLKYYINDEAERLCVVCGCEDYVSGDIYIPAYVNFSGISYMVEGIGTKAFERNTRITGLYIADGVRSVGYFAFYKCTSLTKVVLPKTVFKLGSGAFADCALLETLYIGEAMEDLGSASLSACISLNEVHYQLDAESFNNIKHSDMVLESFKIYNSSYTGMRLELPIHADVLSVESVTVNGNGKSFGTVTRNGKIVSVTLDFDDPSEATGAVMVISGTQNEFMSNYSGDGKSTSGGVLSKDAIHGCRVASLFDGKLFLSGNPLLPNTVFYASHIDSDGESRLYIGVYSYFNDGVGSYKVRSMLPVGDMLAVFKEGDDGSGSIFCHARESTSSHLVPTLYKVTYVHSGISSSGGSLSFMDDPVFITDKGVFALENENINYKRSVVCRSHNVNHDLLFGDLSRASLVEWLGYLVIGINGKLYLADSRAIYRHRTGCREYEWFTVDGIGSYSGDRSLYRYSDSPYQDQIVRPDSIGDEVDCTVYSVEDQDGILHYYTVESYIKYSVYPTGERTGGSFNPATKLASFNGLLFFGTQNGDIGIVNNDKRGIAPPHIAERDDFNSLEYALTMGSRIHPYYYSFAGHPIKCEIRTAMDDCGIPHLTKSTVKKSLTVKASAEISDSIECLVRIDKSDSENIARFPAADADFGGLEFTSAPWSGGPYRTASLAENKKKWIEKQIILRSSVFRSPIRIYSVAYRYIIKGKIKNNR